ncbi:DsbA family oxidoreductase [Amaricoccus sp.]|uniref:DsbA family oxidoreductase n=1 Tax=Amaricoccus sp. TaxID=1872485 RepID=UPI001B435F36|nr:DsbA family oxidoreductase [Amaricoccus sp.]MBP7000452.1 DsbA family oxidoreductase [Amaricoccus sp.]
MTRLEIISDVVCPWCYLGAAQLLRALEARGASPFALSWKPYQLDPDIPPEGRDRAAHMTAKFGDLARVAPVHARLEEAGHAVGLAFDFAAIRRAPNTLDAHRVIRWAAAEGRQTAVAMELFRRYFEAGEDVSDPAVLSGAAATAGLDGAAIARLLAGDADRAEVAAEAEAARAMGVTGVPTFLLGGRYAVSGAQPVEAWTRIADEIEAATPSP